MVVDQCPGVDFQLKIQRLQGLQPETGDLRRFDKINEFVEISLI
jgi:hypothetical protein